MDPTSRSISPENFTGDKGSGAMATEGLGAWAARDLGKGWKISPDIFVNAGQTATLAEIEGSGVITSSWLTAPNNRMRDLILRMYWDGEQSPSVEVPAADFYCDGWLTRPIIKSNKIKLLSANGYISKWKMPFREHAKITLENISDPSDGEDNLPVYYQYNYEQRKISKNKDYFHASWRRAKRLGEPAVFTVIDGIEGRGKYRGTYMGIQPNWDGWWGEGEPKAYIDGDAEFPTICYTGTEDYFGGSWNFDRNGRYEQYTDDEFGFFVSPDDEIYKGFQRSSMYRWHLDDPIRFNEDFRMTIQALGAGDKYVPLVDADIFATSYWYQSSPNNAPQVPLAEQALALGHASLREYLHVDSQNRPPELPKHVAKYARWLPQTFAF